MMDLTDYVRKNEDGFQKMLLEQSSKPLAERCPIARASLAVTLILYDHFEVGSKTGSAEEVKGYQGLDGKNFDKLFRPLLLQWSRLHTAGLHAFFRLWRATGAERDDFEKVAELVRILIEQVVGQAGRTKDALEVEDDLQEFDCARLRELQMELLELSFEDQWGQHLYKARDELKLEALQFVKEQRIRCLLQGSWFSRPTPRRDQHTRHDSLQKRRTHEPRAWRFARLSHNRRYLHYADFADQAPQDPGLDSLTEKVDLSTISSVVSNVSAPNEDGQSEESALTLKHAGTGGASAPRTTTKITIYTYQNPEEAAKGADAKEQAILTLHPTTHSLASEWLDGLLMLLNQAPITAETNKLVTLVSDYGMKIRLLNVRLEAVYSGPQPGAGVVPSREDLDRDYFYDV